MMTAKVYEIYVGHKNLYFSVTYAELVHGVEKSQAAMWSIYRQLKGRCVCLV